MVTNPNNFFLLFCSLFFAHQLSAKETIQAYFANDSVNGLILSDAYESHNMGIVYSTDRYYLKFDLGIVSPDMYVYSNQYRKANRSFGELILLEFGRPDNDIEDLHFYARITATGKFGIDKLQDVAHRLLSLQRVNVVNDLVRMPADVWGGIGIRSEFEPNLPELRDLKIKFDGFVGSDTMFVNAKIIKEIYRPLLIYNISMGGHLVIYDHVVSAPPINSPERSFIPEVSFGISYDAGPYNVFVKDTFSLPTIKSDNSFYGVLSAGVSYEF